MTNSINIELKLSEEEERKLWTVDNVESFLGFSLEELYKIGLKFYKEQERQCQLKLEYNVRLQFMAYFKQIKYGIFKEEKLDCGWFDFVGNDARKAWKKLGTLSAKQTMLEFVKLLDIVCPTTFRLHVKECHELEKSKILLGPEQVNKFEHLVNGSTAKSQEVLIRYQQQKQQIQEALNKQTYHQFLAYAQQTYPGETTKQEELIKQLQEQHYEQYMSQVYAQQTAQVASILEKTSISSANDKSNKKFATESTSSQISPVSTDDSEAGIKTQNSYLEQGLERPLAKKSKQKVKLINEDGEEELYSSNNNCEQSDGSDEENEKSENIPVPSVHGQMGLFCHSNSKISPASMWNSKDIQQFKEAIRKTGAEGILKIEHGESVTVRVPTHDEGYCLFWEFATDNYDLGFGVYFEWTVAENNQVTVHVSESSDEEYDEDELQTSPSPNDLESMGNESQQNNFCRNRKNDANKPPIDEIIPIYRRDCHEKVFAGSHVYPGKGVYLLKFDNTYSLWRSKILYYRVFCSK